MALVTGASRGIGLAVAERLRAEGCQVVRVARSLTPGDASGYIDVSCDLCDTETAASKLTAAIERYGAPDIVVNNAGAFLLKPVGHTTVAEFGEQVSANLLAPFGVLRAALEPLARSGGHLITVGSVVDHQVFAGNAAYAASKHGLRALHEVVALEYRGSIRTTLISPGPTDTSLWDDVDPDARDDLPDRRDMLEPLDVADAVWFAASRPRRANIDLIRLSPSGVS